MIKYKAENYIGKVYGDREIIKDCGKNKDNRSIVLCRCKCGKESVVELRKIINGHNQRCTKCGHDSCKFHKKNIDTYVGKKFGTRTIIENCGTTKEGRCIVKCRCECGEEKIIGLANLINGKQIMCRKCAREIRKYNKKTHGKSKCKLYRTWHLMKERCQKPYCKAYKHYGGRGIKVCDEWNNDFENYYNWVMSHGYIEGENLSVDRIDVDGDYEPNNCRIATPSLQCANQRKKKNNTSGYTGLKLTQDKKRWGVYIGWNKVRHFLGDYKTQKEALEVRNQFIIDNKLPHPIQKYKGETILIDENIPEDRIYYLYIHENKINNKKYIGQTNRDPEKRWLNGRGYKDNDMFFKDIKEFGWDNFTHTVLYTNLTKREADKIESQLIKKYKTLDPNFGYNKKIKKENKYEEVFLIDKNTGTNN